MQLRVQHRRHLEALQLVRTARPLLKTNGNESSPELNWLYRCVSYIRWCKLGKSFGARFIINNFCTALKQDDAVRARRGLGNVYIRRLWYGLQLLDKHGD